MHELFLVTENTDDADKLMAHFCEKAGNLLENCKDMLSEHDRISAQYPKYHFPGEQVLKDAVNEAMREWTNRVDDTLYVLGSVWDLIHFLL